jgi:hypothetical protein
MHPDIDAGALERVAGDFVFNPVKGTHSFRFLIRLKFWKLAPAL